MQATYSPLAACRSLSAHEMGAYRLYVLAKVLVGALDSVKISAIEILARQYISKRQFQRDKRAALSLGLLRIHERKNGEKVFILVSHVRAALLLGATKSSESKRSTVSLDELFSDQWQAIAFTRWQAMTTENGLRLVSQKKQAELTRIQPQMQRKYNKSCGIVSRRNYAVSNISANQLSIVREFCTRAAPFAFKNHKTNQSYLAWRLPSTRVVCADSSTLNPSKIEGSLISTNPNAEGKGGSLFWYGEKSFTNAIRSCAADQQDLYIFSHVSKSGAGMFTHFSI